MSPNMKIILVILTMAMGVMLITSKVEAQDAPPLIENNIEGFKQCSLWIKGTNRASGLIEPIKERAEVVENHINDLTNQMDQIEMDLKQFAIMMQAAQEERDWENLERFYRRYNKAATMGNVLAQEALAMSQLFMRLGNGIQRRADVYNKLNALYTSNCIIQWPPIVFDAACSTKQYDTIDFCEKFPND